MMKQLFRSIVTISLFFLVGFFVPKTAFASSCGVSNTSITSTGFTATVTFQTSDPFPSHHFPVTLQMYITGSGTVEYQGGIDESECNKQFGTTSTVTYTCPISAPNALANKTLQPGATYVFQGIIKQATSDTGTSCQGFATAPQAITKTCGQAYSPATETCSCASNGDYNPPDATRRCCGWISDTLTGLPGCLATAPTPAPPGPINPSSGATQLLFSNLNAAIFGAAGPDIQLTTPRGIISKLLPYLFTFAGLILFIMIIWGGFEMLTGASNPKSQEAGKQRITAAIVGFLLLFASYWLAQIIEAVFKVSIL